MSGTDSDQTLQTLYNEILTLVEEEIYQRKCGKKSTEPEIELKGGTSNVNPLFCPGKFDAVRHSLNVPLNVALRGTAARLKLFTSENKL